MELELANEEFHLFRSDHEAVGVLWEEVEEAESEATSVRNMFKEFKDCVFNDWEQDMPSIMDSIGANAIEAACEFIQVAAMAKKWKYSRTAEIAGEWEMSHKNDFPQEHADALADNMTPEEVKKFCCETPSFLKKDGTITIANGKMKLTIKTKGEKDAE